MFCYCWLTQNLYNLFRHMISILSLLYNIMKIVNTYLRFMADGFSSFLGADCSAVGKVLHCLTFEGS